MDSSHPATASYDHLPVLLRVDGLGAARLSSNNDVPVSADQLQLPNHDNSQRPALDAENSSSVQAFPRTLGGPGPTSPPSSIDAPTSALSVASPVSSTISSQLPFSTGMLPMVNGSIIVADATGGPIHEADRGTDRHGTDLGLVPPQTLGAVSDDTSAGVGATVDSVDPPNMSRNALQADQEFSESANLLSFVSPPQPWVVDLIRSHAHVLTGSHGAAERFINCMEVVPDELVIRYEKLRESSGGDGVDGCAICQDSLVDAPSPNSDTIEGSDASRTTVAFPCAGKHLFHRECLLRWLAQKTTCPHCRFDIDPQVRRSVQDPLCAWKPPVVESMRDWLEAEEKASETGVPRERPATVMPEYPTPPRASADPNTSFPLTLHAFGDLDMDPLMDFEEDFAAWFYPENAESRTPSPELQTHVDTPTPADSPLALDPNLERDFAAFFDPESVNTAPSPSAPAPPSPPQP